MPTPDHETAVTKKREFNEGFPDFMDMLTAYRKTRVLLCAHELGLFESLAIEPLTATDICMKTGMDKGYGERFLDVLVQLGLLEQGDKGYGLSPFSRRYLVKGAWFYQGESLEFEKTLIQSWQNISETLIQGKRVFNAGEKSRDDYQSSLALYLKSMDNAARIRAGELWSIVSLSPSKKGGLILDAGAGSGAFLKDFLNRHPSWTGVFCDLPDVIELARDNPDLSAVQDRIEFIAQNFLDETDPPTQHTADILLCSNLVHCQGREETQTILARLACHVAPEGCLIIHDFFTDQGSIGALYDIHMMLNTYNGRTYRMDEIESIVNALGFVHRRSLHLASSSLVLVCSRQAFSENFFISTPKQSAGS